MNITLREQGYKRKRLQKKQFEEGGLKAVGGVALHNLNVLMVILDWNNNHGIQLYRTTDIFPWMDQYKFEDLPNWEEIESLMRTIGEATEVFDQRITVHPSSFCVLASPTDKFVETSIIELDQASRIFNHMGLIPNHYNKINIHIGGVYKDKKATLERFCSNFQRLLPSTRARLTVENDDKKNGYTVKDLYEGIYQKIGVPIVFDYLHHSLNPGGLSEKDALKLALSSWEHTAIPVVHFSSSKKEWEDSAASPAAHSDWIYEQVDTYGEDVDIMFEVKQTEKAVLDVIDRSCII